MSEKNNPIMFPNYDNSILSVSASVAQYYGIKTPYKTNTFVDKELEKGYKNIVLMVADGLGMNILTQYLPSEAFLRQHYKETISSVFPPTTGAALTTIRSVQPPLVHGWLGWSLYFKKFNAVAELFKGTNMYTGEPIPDFGSGFKQLPYTQIWEQVQNARPDIETTAFFPDRIDKKGIENLHQLMSRIYEQTRSEKQQFIWAYWHEPDSTEHHFGPYSEETRKRLSLLNRRLKKGCDKLKDTLVILIADHGQISIKETILINDCGKMADCLLQPLNMDCRSVNVFVKPEMKSLFEAEFLKYLSADFLLVSREDVLSAHLFGYGTPNISVDETLGDYLIIGITDKSLEQSVPLENGLQSSVPYLKGGHSGLTQDEMSVPLILIPSSDKQ